VPKKRQIVITRSARIAGGKTGAAVSLGIRRDVVSDLGRFNTASDGSPSTTGTDRLWGPGMIVELPMGEAKDDVAQAMVTVTDEEIAMPVLLRMCKTLGWAMVDIETGRSFG
jgi:hypothetical protein